MSSLGGNRSIKLWTCSRCREVAISISLGDCPQCGHARCIDCDVKSHVMTDAEENEETKKKFERPSASENTRVDPASSGENQLSMNVIDDRAVERTRDELIEGDVHCLGIATGIERHPCFVLREISDAQLIFYWNLFLPELSDLCKRNHSQLQIVSIHLFRIGTDELGSTPTIIVNTAARLGRYEEVQLQRTIADVMRGFLGGRTEEPVCQLMFKQSRLRRSLESVPLPPICRARNRQCVEYPGTGASIGISGSFEDTATLGCYVLIHDRPLVLTVDHLIPEASGGIKGLTHTSQQDFLDTGHREIVKRISRLRSKTIHSCKLCDLIDLSSPASIYQFSKASLTTIWGPVDSTLDKSCPFFEVIWDHQWYALRKFGTMFARSERRSKFCGSVRRLRREMDWSLFEVSSTATRHARSRSDLDEHIMFRARIAEEEGMPGELNLQPMKAGAMVKCLGRTSGIQVGQISTTMGAIFHEDYVTQEWTVVNRSGSSSHEWVRGGIGVEGDSGALIVDAETDAVYGMLWGRTGDGPSTVTIFTPMEDIFNDIKAQTRESRIELLRGQNIPYLNSDDSLETSTDSVPILAFPHEELGELKIEEATTSFSATQQSSVDTRHPHSFERYRGRDSTDRNVPRSSPTTTSSVEAETSQRPGVHTYMRYVVAPEQE